MVQNLPEREGLRAGGGGETRNRASIGSTPGLLVWIVRYVNAPVYVRSGTIARRTNYYHVHTQVDTIGISFTL
jgi:hypothetical protein